MTYDVGNPRSGLGQAELNQLNRIPTFPLLVIECPTAIQI
jgi:hypothetical protein